MTRPSKTVVVDKAYELGYDELQEIVAACGGWMRSSGPDGDTATVWHDDTEYVFKERGLVEFLYAVKNRANDGLRDAQVFCDYVIEASKQPASVYVLDAIVGRAERLKQKLLSEGGPR